MLWSNGFLRCTDLRLLNTSRAAWAIPRQRYLQARRTPDGRWLLRLDDRWRAARLDGGWQCGDCYGLGWRLLSDGHRLTGCAWLRRLDPAARRRWRVLLRYGRGIA